MSDYPEEILKKLSLLEKKYAKIGQDMGSYLDGLLYSNILTYWDYIHLDTLLSIQKPKTDFEDEMIFITYHQMTELMFNLILHELKQLCDLSEPNATHWQKHLERVIRYYKNLINSFDIMIEGMEKEAFRKFRMSLLPASGFQSVQYRKIEMYCTGLSQLLSPDKRDKQLVDTSLENLYEHSYWKLSNRELKSGNKTLTLKMFEDRYDEELLRLAKSLETKNINYQYTQSQTQLHDNDEIVKLLREVDLNANLFWPMVHYGAADKFLKEKTEVLIATGGTNWQTYLPPNQQKVVFFPTVWNQREIKQWGTRGG